MAAFNHNGASALRSVTPAPEMDDARELPGRAGIEGQETERDEPNFAELAQERKRVATVAATLALRAAQLHELRTGGFMVTGAGLVAHFSDLTAVEAWVKRRGSRS